MEPNMVRCGAVRHPREWKWVGYYEVMGYRQRYRLLDLDRLCWRQKVPSLEELRQWIEEALQERIARGEIKRMECWTQALGVGSRPFLDRSQSMILTRLNTTIVEQDDGLCVLKEEPSPYGNKPPLKISLSEFLMPKFFITQCLH